MDYFGSVPTIYIDLSMAGSIGVGIGFAVYVVAPLSHRSLTAKRVRLILSVPTGLLATGLLLAWFSNSW